MAAPSANYALQMLGMSGQGDQVAAQTKDEAADRKKQKGLGIPAVDQPGSAVQALFGGGTGFGGMTGMVGATGLVGKLLGKLF